MAGGQEDAVVLHADEFYEDDEPQRPMKRQYNGDVVPQPPQIIRRLGPPPSHQQHQQQQTHVMQQPPPQRQRSMHARFVEFKGVGCMVQTQKIDCRRFCGLPLYARGTNPVRISSMGIGDAVRMLMGRRLRTGIITATRVLAPRPDFQMAEASDGFEKNLHVHTDIGGSLRDIALYPIEAHELLLSSHVGVRLDDGLHQARLVDVISMGMVSRPALTHGGHYAAPQQIEVFRQQFTGALDLAWQEGMTGLVIAPLGCEYQQHPAYQIAGVMRELLSVYGGHFLCVLILTTSRDIEVAFQEIFLGP